MRQRIQRCLQSPEWSEQTDRAIARHLGCSGKTVAKVARSLGLERRAREVNRGGTKYTVHMPEKAPPLDSIIADTSRMRHGKLPGIPDVIGSLLSSCDGVKRMNKAQQRACKNLQIETILKELDQVREQLIGLAA